MAYLKFSPHITLRLELQVFLTPSNTLVWKKKIKKQSIVSDGNLTVGRKGTDKSAISSEKENLFIAIIVTFCFGKIAWCNYKQVHLSHSKSKRK